MAATALKKVIVPIGISQIVESKLEKIVREIENEDDFFAKIYSSHYPKIYSFLRSHYPKCYREDIEDVVQETFISAYKKINTLKEDKYLSTWLHRVAINKMIDHLRKKLKTITNSNIPIIIDNDNPEHAIREKEYGMIFNEIISTLSDRHKKVFTLRVVYGFSFDEISNSIGNLPYDTVKDIFYKAKCEIVRKYSNYIEKNGVFFPPLRPYFASSEHIKSRLSDPSQSI